MRIMTAQRGWRRATSGLRAGIASQFLHAISAKVAIFIVRRIMRGTILVVDDEPDQLEVVQTILSEVGFSVDTVTNGFDALKMVEKSLPGLIIVDANMPKMNGFALCESLRRAPATAGIPIIMLTGLVGNLSRMNGLLHGASAYVTKPYKIDELVGKVNELLKHSDPPAAPGRSPER
jgi:DNA-binding response OmpR family regulator